LVRWPAGEFVWGPHVSGLGVRYRDLLAISLGVPVMVDNDANLAAFAEAMAGAGQGYVHVLALTFGTGIGGGMVFDGEIYRGRGFAGEMGHMTMQPDGLLCACGRRGCWETLVSGGRLDQLALDLVSQTPDGPVARLAAGTTPAAGHLSAAAEAGDPAARSILAEAGDWLGRGVANLMAVLDPEVVVVGGAVAQAKGWLLDPARMAIASHLTGFAYRDPAPLVEARFGRLSGAVGAALLAGRLIE
jgi:glucokinase